MTTLKPAAPLRRETGTRVRGRALVVELHTTYMMLREKRRRHGVAVEYRAILDLGYKLLARWERAQKEANRKGRGRAA
jgi:hypothetical protein